MATFDINNFRILLRTAIGDKKQQDFATEAGLSKSRITHMLNDKEIGTPTKTTLLKICNASNGKVGMNQLLQACGYDILEKYKSPSVENDYEYAKSMKDGVMKLIGPAARYNDIEDFLDTVVMLYAENNVETYVSESEEYSGKGHKGAERYVHCKLIWRNNTHVFTLPFVLFYCETTGGGVVLFDSVFDLNGLIKMGNACAGGFLMNIAEKGDVNCSDYEFIVSTRETCKEERLLRAIFGSLEQPDGEEDDNEICDTDCKLT